MMPLISLVVPVYKVEQYIDRCINSILKQDYKNIEILLIDDGSPDNCPQICDDYALRDKRIKVIHKKNGGLSDARNFGIDKANGDYIIFVDSDDYIEYDTCTKFAQAVKDIEADIVVGNAKILQNDNIRNMYHSYKATGAFVSGKEYLLQELKSKTMHMAAWLNMYNRNFLLKNNLQFKVGLLHEDEQFTPRAFLLAEKVISTDIVFYNYIIRDNSITTQKNKTRNAKSIVKICKELEPIYDQLENNELKYLLKEHLVNIYLNSFHQAKLYKNNLKHLVDIGFLERNALSKRNKDRIKILKCSKRLYYVIYIMNRRLNNLRKKSRK